MKRRVAIVGAGFGGLSAACELAAAGLEVTLFERSATVGGKAGRLEHAGYRWDTGPTLLTMPDTLDRPLSFVGKRLADLVKLHPLAPLCRYAFAGGERFDHHVDVARTAAEIARFSPEDAEAWPRFLAWAKHTDAQVGAEYMDVPFTGLLDFAARMARRGPAAVATGSSFGTLEALAARWFRSTPMRQFVGRLATYVGAAPALASAAFGTIAAVESRGDAVYPEGGIHAVAVALAGAATELGVALRLGAGVDSLRRDGRGFEVGSAAGRERFDALILDIDPLFAARLFPQGSAEARALGSGAQAARSLSGCAVLLGLEGRTEGLALHNVLFPRDQPAEFRDLFEAGRPPQDGTVYVSAASHVDAGNAPPGHEALFCLVNAPARPELDWKAESARLTEHVVAVLERHHPGFAARRRVAQVLTPVEFARTGSLDGALYGAAPHGLLGPFQRPLQRVQNGLFLAGGATHPGGGVPMVVRSGRHAAALLLRESGMELAAAPRAAA